MNCDGIRECDRFVYNELRIVTGDDNIRIQVGDFMPYADPHGRREYLEPPIAELLVQST